MGQETLEALSKNLLYQIPDRLIKWADTKNEVMWGVLMDALIMMCWKGYL